MLQKSSTWKTAGVFFESPTREHYLLEISRETGIAHTSVKNNLTELACAGIINETITKRGKRNFPTYKADMENKNYRRYKIIYNLTSLMDSGIIKSIEDSLAPRSIILFGSYQRGEDTEESDIDLLVECEKSEIQITNFEKKLRRKVQLHFKKDFTKLPKELKNNIINGSVMAGFLEGYR